MVKQISLCITLFLNVSIFSQSINLDKYKYMVVAEKFDFLKEVDQYQTSSLLKFLLKKKGFEVFLGNENLPSEIVNNRCLSLFASIKDESSMLSIKSIIEIKDCYGKVVLASTIGKSKLKDYKRGYHEAIRDAYGSLDEFVYNYKPNLIVVQKIEEEVPETVNSNSNIVEKPLTENTETKIVNIVSEESTILYAQPKGLGFQLVNLKPQVVFVILKTNVKDVFVIKDKNGILYKSGETWVAEYYLDNQLVKNEFQIKF